MIHIYIFEAYNKSHKDYPEDDWLITVVSDNLLELQQKAAKLIAETDIEIADCNIWRTKGFENDGRLYLEVSSGKAFTYGELFENWEEVSLPAKFWDDLMALAEKLRKKHHLSNRSRGMGKEIVKPAGVNIEKGGE